MKDVSRQDFDGMCIAEISIVVLDFETVTPKGVPPEPIEIGAIRLLPGFCYDSSFEVSWFIRPPDNAPLTSFDTQQTGICWRDLHEQPVAESVLKQFDTLIGNEPVLIVAQNASYEYGIIQRFALSCPGVATHSFIDTVALAKALIPELHNYRLDTLAHHCALSIPVQRHRALPDVQLTAEVFIHLLQQPNSPKTVADLKRIAGIKTVSTRNEEGLEQLFLFS